MQGLEKSRQHPVELGSELNGEPVQRTACWGDVFPVSCVAEQPRCCVLNKLFFLRAWSSLLDTRNCNTQLKCYSAQITVARSAFSNTGHNRASHRPQGGFFFVAVAT